MDPAARPLDRGQTIVSLWPALPTKRQPLIIGQRKTKQNTGKLSELLRKTRRFEAGVVHVAHVSHVLQFSRGSAQRQAAGHERRRRQGLSIGQPSGRQRQRQPPDARPRPGRRAQPPSLLPTPSQSESRLRELFTCPFRPFSNNK